MRLLGLLEESFLVGEEFRRSQVPVIVQASLATPLSASNPSVRKRLFSYTGNVVTTRRKHLLPKHVEQFVYTQQDALGIKAG